jgi:hypothetical protein
MQQRSRAGGFIESGMGAKMFEHLQDMDYSSSSYTHESIPQLPETRTTAAGTFSWAGEEHNELFLKRWRSCTVGIGEKMLEFAYSWTTLVRRGATMPLAGFLGFN